MYFFATNCSKKPQNNRLARQKKNNNNKKKSGVFDQRFFWKFFTFFRVRVVVTKNYDFGKGFSFSSLISIYAQVLLSWFFFFFLAVTLWFHYFFRFSSTVLSQLLTFQNYLLFFRHLRWFFYADLHIFFVKEIIIEVFVLFSCVFFRARSRN